VIPEGSGDLKGESYRKKVIKKHQRVLLGKKEKKAWRKGKKISLQTHVGKKLNTRKNQEIPKKKRCTLT